jgi:uncharacterized protein (TIGR02271 family)
MDKERVEAGEVRIRKEVVTEQQNIEVPVSREEARIETEGRTTVRPLDSRSARPYKGKERRRRAQTSYSGPERREAVL